MSHTHARLRISSPAPVTLTHDARGGLGVVVVPVDAGQATVQLLGELDLSSVELAAEVLDNQLKLGYRSIRLDLSRLTLTDCTGLGLLVRAHNQCLTAHGALVLTGVTAAVARLLAITGLNKSLFIVDDLPEPPRARPPSASW